MAASLQTITLTEYVASPAALGVDREAGVIRGVKILGLVSANGRRYTAEALRKAAPLYEGQHVNVNHAAKPGLPRSAYDRFGRTVRVRLGDDGLYGDLEYLKTHPLAGPLAEAAERMPGAFGLSHTATGKERRTRGESVIESIEAVASVDLVADPATTHGLFEAVMDPVLESTECELRNGEERSGETAAEDGLSLQELREQVTTLKHQARARELCDEQGIVPNKVLRAALDAARDEAAMKELIEEFRRSIAADAAPGRPRSGLPATRLAEGAVPKFEDRKKRAAFLRGAV